MAKDFDIFLSKQITECDIIVYSLPYREGLSVSNRLILESCVKAYTLQKMIAVQAGSKLVAHIDEMLKICNERLSTGVELAQSAEFSAAYTMKPDDMVIRLGADDLSVLERSFTDARSSMMISAKPLLAYITRPFGPSVTMPIKLKASVSDFKQSFIKANTAAIINVPNVDTWKQDYEQFEDKTVVQANLADLCYSIYTTVDTAIGIYQYVIGTEIHRSFGRGNSRLFIRSALDGTNAEKFIVAENVARILSDVTESAIKFLTVEDNAIAIDASASSIMRRYRLLYEMDGFTHADFDGLTLEDLDYVNL